MDPCLLESKIGFTNPSVSPVQSEKVSGCQMNNHHLVQDEQIGLIYTVCSHIQLDNKYIFPPFGSIWANLVYERKCLGQSPLFLDDDGFRFSESSAVQDSPISREGTVWDLVPLSVKATMYPHQHGAFEFVWKNLAGEITLERLKEPLSDNGEGYTKESREILLKFPGLLVLEEGHTVRNKQSLVWKSLNKVETQNRILLSETPFQNNIKELYNTLFIVSPKFVADSEKKWASLSSSIDKNTRALEELRDIISPFLHKCSENVKRVSLPGIRNTVIHLKPTDLQKDLLKRIPENPGSFHEQNLVSLISVHPLLVEKKKEFPEFETLLKERRFHLDPDIGEKIKFVAKLIRLWWGKRESYNI
ncbi:putative transcriptional regulator ATRX -like protein [Capsicum annuum]|nr:putative transcriptional regulator ATRX -like protein [Capsicum annuum]KAF3682289.1 putative transcriptional regulator ATRX -like protein [Capsicum annuum]